MQLRRGPNRVSFFGLPVLRGLAQPFADVIKLLLKEIIVPGRSSRFLFLLAPLIVLVPAIAVWAVIPFSPEFVLADIDAGLLLCPRADIARCLRRDPRGLGQQFQVRVPRRDEVRGPDGRLRDRDGLRARRRADGGGKPQSRRDRARADGWIRQLELAVAVPAVHRLFRVGPRGDEPRPVRRGGRGVGDRRGFPRRIFGRGLCIALRAARIREHDPDFGPDGRACSSADGCRPSRATLRTTP